MARSVKKGPFVQEALMTKVAVLNSKNEKRVVKTWSRASTILLIGASRGLGLAMAAEFCTGVAFTTAAF